MGPPRSHHLLLGALVGPGSGTTDEEIRRRRLSEGQQIGPRKGSVSSRVKCCNVWLTPADISVYRENSDNADGLLINPVAHRLQRCQFPRTSVLRTFKPQVTRPICSWQIEVLSADYGGQPFVGPTTSRWTPRAGSFFTHEIYQEHGVPGRWPRPNRARSHDA